jgi:hypothetical protein
MRLRNVPISRVQNKGFIRDPRHLSHVDARLETRVLPFRATAYSGYLELSPWGYLALHTTAPISSYKAPIRLLGE